MLFFPNTTWESQNVSIHTLLLPRTLALEEPLQFFKLASHEESRLRDNQLNIPSHKGAHVWGEYRYKDVSPLLNEPGSGRSRMYPYIRTSTSSYLRV